MTEHHLAEAEDATMSAVQVVDRLLPVLQLRLVPRPVQGFLTHGSMRVSTAATRGCRAG